MAESPYLSDGLRDYIQQHRVQEVLHRSVNGLLRATPADPFSYLMDEMAALASQDITVLTLAPLELTQSDLQPQLELYVTTRFQQK
jgi:hypothetical protein